MLVLPPQIIQSTTAFEKKASVQSATIASQYKFIQTAGYYSAEDGGGALYTRTNNGAQGQITDSVPSTWYVSNKKLTPRMYGAKSDGTDSLTAFQAWAADVSSGIGYGEIDRETYHISDSLTFTGTDLAVENRGTITQTGTSLVGIVPAAKSARVMMPMVFWASFEPWLKAM
jgi:hypothetical protein